MWPLLFYNLYIELAINFHNAGHSKIRLDRISVLKSNEEAGFKQVTSPFQKTNFGNCCASRTALLVALAFRTPFVDD